MNLHEVGENVVRVIIGFLGREETLAVSSVSRTLRAIVKRASNRMRVRVTDPGELAPCFRAWPSVTRLLISRPLSPLSSCAALSKITDLVLEDATVSPDVVRLLRSVRTLSLTRCSVATLDAPELVELSITAPIGGQFPELIARTVRSVHCTDVSLGILGPVSRLLFLESLSLTRPHPSASVPNPFAVICAIESLKRLSLCHFDAMNVHIERTTQIKITLDFIRVDFCLVCADDPLLAYSHQCRRSNHECSEYTRRIETDCRATQESALSSYETYVHNRLACPLIHHQHGLRLLFAASLVDFERTYEATAYNVRRLVARTQ
jgi:hypothetical protein